MSEIAYGNFTLKELN